MSTQFSMIGLMNAALQSQGLDEIVSEGDGTPEFRVLSRNWPTIVEAELEDGLYEFAREQMTLLSRQPGRFGFADSYLLPTTALHVRHVWATVNGGRGQPDWLQDGVAVHLNSATGCTVEVVTVPDPSIWGANFSRGVQLKLEAVIARALKEEDAASFRLEQAAEMHFQRARTSASKSRAARPMMQPGRIALARFGHGAR